MNKKLIILFFGLILLIIFLLVINFNRYEYVRVNYYDGDVTLRFDNLFPNREPCVIETDMAFVIHQDGEFGLRYQFCQLDYYDFYKS